jgi:23S rRNA pseudouridine2605 synthase
MLSDQLGERIAALAGADFLGPIVDRSAPLEREEHRHPDVRGGKAAEPRRAAAPEKPPHGRHPSRRAPLAPQDDDRKRITRTDTIADRRGRQIHVTRTRTEKPERPATPKRRGGKSARPDRARGPRPSRPR